jgi:hypothetical protein
MIKELAALTANQSNAGDGGGDGEEENPHCLVGFMGAYVHQARVTIVLEYMNR